MRVLVHADPAASVAAAADQLSAILTARATRTVMVAGGNTPLPLYAEISRRRLALERLRVFALDEYLGVPPDDPRTVGNLLRRTVAAPWGIPPERFHALPSMEPAGSAAVAHERLIAEAGGLDVVVLGLGTNGHLGFNEPGSARDSRARVLPLDPTSIEANRAWFGGDHAPERGVTTGIATLLEARAVIIQAYGAAKAQAVAAMTQGSVGPACPASFLREHPDVTLYLDPAARG